MIKYIKDRKYIIIFSIIVFICQIFIISSVGRHGIDDYEASTYYNYPNMTFEEKIVHIFDRAEYWNCRFGEIIYFIIGCFPSFVFWIIDAIFMVIISNLVVYYSVGKKVYNENNKVGVLILIVYLIMIYIFPEISKSLFWMGSIFNHLFSVILLLFAFIPFKNEMDGIEIKFDSLLKFICYLLICFISGIGSECAVVAIICGIVYSNLKDLYKLKHFNLYKILPLIVMVIGFIILIFMSSIRVESFSNDNFAINSKENLLEIMIENRMILIIVFLVINIMYFSIFKINQKKEIVNMYRLFLIFSISVIVTICFTYYVDRAILIFDIGLTIILLYELYQILNKLKFNGVYVILSFSTLFFLVYLTYNYYKAFKDYNEFQKLRKEYIYEHAKENILIVPKYDYKVNLKFVYNYKNTLIEGIEWEDIYKNNISTLYGVDPEIYIIDLNNEYNIRLR